MTTTNRSALLLLEQNSHVRDLVSDFLAEYQFSVTCAKDGYEALDRVREERPALVITEVLTPRLDGISLCSLIKKDESARGTKILVLSLFSMEARALQAGADAFLLKPIEKNSLIAAVRSLIEPMEQKKP